MFIDKDSIKVKVGSGNWVSLGQYLTEAKYSFNKLWASDSGRNLAGKQTGSLIGIFPKIVVTFRRLSKTELETLAPILDSSSQSFKYYDPVKGTTTINTYTGDYEYSNKNIIGIRHKNEPFSISFIAREKRS